MPYNKKCLLKWFFSLRVLPLLALLLAFSSNAFAVGYYVDDTPYRKSLHYPSIDAACSSISGTLGQSSTQVTSVCGSVPIRYCSSSAYNIDTWVRFAETNPCPSGKSFNCLTGQCAADDPLDDCSASPWGDLSGNNNDDSCGCPSPSVNNGFGACVTCGEGQVVNASGQCASPCPGNLQLVNGSCGCLAGQTLGSFNGVQSCQASSTAAPITQGGGTLVTESGTTINVVNNIDGTTTTTTTTNNNTTIVGGSAGSGTGSISNGTNTMSVTTDASGQVVSATGSSQVEEKQDSLTLPAVLDARELSIGDGISQAFANAPIFSALNDALGAFPTSGACSVISLTLKIPYNPPVHVNMSEQCELFADIANYLTIFAMVIYGLLSYKAFIRSASEA